MISFKIGQYIISKKAILILLFGCFLTGILIGVNIASKAFSAPILFIFIVAIWISLYKAIGRNIYKEI